MSSGYWGDCTTKAIVIVPEFADEHNLPAPAWPETAFVGERRMFPQCLPNELNQKLVQKNSLVIKYPFISEQLRQKVLGECGSEVIFWAGVPHNQALLANGWTSGHWDCQKHSLERPQLSSAMIFIVLKPPWKPCRNVKCKRHRHGGLQQPCVAFLHCNQQQEVEEDERKC